MYVTQVTCLRTLWSCAVLLLAAGQFVAAQEAQKPSAPKPPEQTKQPEQPKKADEAKKSSTASPPTDILRYADIADPGVLFSPTVAFDLVTVDQDNGLGADVAPAEGALRAHLDLPKDQGLVVTNVRSGSAAEKAGLQKHDVVLTVGGKPVVTLEALNEQLKAAAEKAVAISLLRGGKRLTLEVTPKRGEAAYAEVFLSQVGQGRSYWIGVTASEADETLRAQLRLPEKRGLVVTEVKDDSPAKKAGVLVNDVLLEFGGKPLSTIEDLSKLVQEIAEKPAGMKLLRSGQQQTLQVTPAKRPEETAARLVHGIALSRLAERQRLSQWLAPAENVQRYPLAVRAAIAAPPRDARAELADLVQEVRKLNQRIEALDRSLKAAEKGPAKEEKK